ncbi:MAG: hypothetical protein ACREX3_23135 [Gammaproteobacteria bacterium]
MPVRVFAVGAFGGEVVRRATHSAVGLLEISSLDEARSGDLIALVAARPTPDLARQLDSDAFRRAYSFVPIWMDGYRCQIGPFVIPPEGPCFACYERRQRQHSRRLLIDCAIEDFRARHPVPPDLCPDPPLAAAVAAELAWIGSTASAAPTPGEVTRIGFPPRGTVRGHVVRVHGCNRCGMSGSRGQTVVGREEVGG